MYKSAVVALVVAVTAEVAKGADAEEEMEAWAAARATAEEERAA